MPFSQNFHAVPSSNWLWLAQTVASVLAVAAVASASWAEMTDEQLVSRSAVIVVGTLAKSDVPGAFGVMEVREVLKGKAAEPLVLGGRPELVASNSLFYRVGQTGLWFLRPASDDKPGVYLADHPQRFISDVSTSDFWRAIVAAENR